MVIIKIPRGEFNLGNLRESSPCAELSRPLDKLSAGKMLINAKFYFNSDKNVLLH